VGRVRDGRCSGGGGGGMVSVMLSEVNEVAGVELRSVCGKIGTARNGRVGREGVLAGSRLRHVISRLAKPIVRLSAALAHIAHHPVISSWPICTATYNCILLPLHPFL